MSKYIIELDENAKEVVVISLEDGDMWTETMEVEDLEQLNSDYINEHFGGLQDDAYNKGYAQCQDDYGDALKHAKDTAYKKGFEDGKAIHDKGCEGCLYNDGTKEHSPCDICCNAYLNRWTAKPQEDDKIEVGDEVEISQSDENDVWVVTKVEKHDDYEAYCAINKDGDNIYFEEEQDRVTKTGRHFDIKSILEAMKHD